MAGFPSSQADFDNNIAKMEPEVDRVKREVDKCTQKASDVEPPPSFWDYAGQGLISAVFPIAGIYFGVKHIERIINNNPEVQEQLAQAQQCAADILAELGRLVSPGNPFLMKLMADRWDDVNTQLTGVLQPLDPLSFVATTTWKDPMGERYAMVPGAQQAALEGLLPHIDSMRQYMRSHSDTIINLWWDIWMEIVGLVIDAIPLAASFLSANPLKWADIAKSIADCVARVLTAVKEMVNLIFEFTMESNSQIEGLKSAASDVSGTHFGNWPEARLA
jgi:hypothetical protein